ncbi:MAG: LPS assembly lipoprotein LptE [Planctomycetaceae bacterium]|nr:LPS assembly lipoprotein LptE [Planctomycetaceae bacterium]
MHRIARIAGLGFLAVACVAAGGCGKAITVMHYPAFYSPELRTIAVMPFAPLPPEPPSGVFFTDRLVDALADNGAYRVASGPQLLAELQAAGLTMPSAPISPPASQPTPQGQPSAEYYYVVPTASGPPLDHLLAALRRRGGIDLVLLGQVTALSVQPVIVQDSFPYGPYAPYPYPLYGPYGSGYYTAYTYENQATAAATVELYRVSDGQHLASASRTATVVSVGPTRLTMEQSLGRAAQDAARQLVQIIAPSPETVKVTPGAIETSRRAEGGGMKETSTFSPSDGAMMVTLHLPPAADRNPFTLTVTPENNSNRTLFSRPFTWSAQAGQTIEIPLAALGGPGDYRINLQRGGQTVLDKKITMR